MCSSISVRVSGHDVGWGLVAMSLASLGVYALMFAVGSCIYGEWVRGLILTLTAVLSGVFLTLSLKRL